MRAGGVRATPRPAPRFGAAFGIALGCLVLLASAVGFVPALAPVPAAAAIPGLTMIGQTTYDVLPEEGRVAVTVQLTARNNLKDTVTRRFTFGTGYITVLPGVSNLVLTGDSDNAQVTVLAATETYTNLKIDFGTNLAAGKSMTFRLTFDLLDAGRAPDRPVRVSHSLVTFAAWAVATPSTPGASVDVRLPDGYSVTVRRGPLDGPVSDATGHERWTSGVLEAPLDFVADIAADRPAVYVETSRTAGMAAGPATVLVRSWPDDDSWRDRVGSLVERALPILEREIGVPWPIEGPLAVHEALLRTTGGFAGVFDPATGSIEIAYSASDGVILHELAHAWFNGRLVADRWAAEGFAAYYAALVAKELGVDPSSPALPDEPSGAAIPLNAWGPTGSEDTATESWAYAASLELARETAGRADPEALRAVWSRAARGIGAYQADVAGGDLSAGEVAATTPDWRGLLDLLETESGQDLTGLWRQWVARPDDLAALADRAEVRGSYLRTLGLAGDWRLPPAPRLAMRAWRFDVARELLLATQAVLAQRDALITTAAAAGVTLPGTLRATFEGDGGLASAAAEAEEEQTTVDAIAGAEAARPAETGIVDQTIVGIGLLSADPDARLAAARTALAAGDVQAAYPAATAAQATWASAAALGRSRIVNAVLLLLALILAVAFVRQRRRARAQTAG